MSKSLDQNGHGIIVFTEDIDQVTRGERTNALQDILNTLDGGDTKNMNVIALFTTNHLELIEPTFLRGKRIGTIISMPYLNAASAESYIKHFCQGVTLEGDFEPVYKLVEESKIAPAFMAEIVENLKSNLVLTGTSVIKAKHFETCVNSYLRQVGLSKTKDTSMTKEQNLANSLKEVIHDDSFYQQIAGITREVLAE
jgi:ATP-dependent 26S proteasome regulatory subunit